MPFVQIIKFRSSRYDEMRALEQEWDAAARDRGTVRRVRTSSRSFMSDQRGSPAGTHRSLASGPFSSAIQNTPMTRART